MDLCGNSHLQNDSMKTLREINLLDGNGTAERDPKETMPDLCIQNEAVFDW